MLWFHCQHFFHHAARRHRDEFREALGRRRGCISWRTITLGGRGRTFPLYVPGARSRKTRMPVGFASRKYVGNEEADEVFEVDQRHAEPIGAALCGGSACSQGKEGDWEEH